jgi:mannose-1-phosphate guanylyltransferase
MVKALILVGGFGTRLRPLTLTIPKPLVPFMNKPMIVHQIEALQKAGVDEIILAINYQPNVMKKEMEKFASDYHVKITYSLEAEPLGTAGPLALARDSLTADGNELFFVLNSDISCVYPLEALLKFHKAHGKEGTIMVTKVLEPSKYGVVVSNKEGVIQQFVEKPQTFVGNRINAGIYIFHKDVLQRIKPEPTSIERVIFPQIAKEGKLYSMDLEGFWMDIGQPPDYLSGTSLYLQHQKQAGLLKEAVLVSNSSKIGKDCVIGPDVVIGDDVIIGDGVRIKKSVIFSGTKIGSNSFISGSIIGWNCSIGKWNRIENCSVFGEDIQTNDEIFVNGGKVLPHKSLNASVTIPDSIIM